MRSMITKLHYPVLLLLIISDIILRINHYGTDMCVNNQGAGFSIVFPFVFYPLFFFVLFYYRKSDPAIHLIISGALINLLDRIVNGSICDYIQLELGSGYLVLNIADILITIGIIIVIYKVIYAEVKSK